MADKIGYQPRYLYTHVKFFHRIVFLKCPDLFPEWLFVGYSANEYISFWCEMNFDLHESG